MDEQTRIEIEAATFRRLMQHLQSHTEVQNIDLMLLADFCRNCLAKWYSTAATDKGQTLDYPAAQAIIYGMPYTEWKSRFQKEATQEQLEAMRIRQQKEQAAQ